jgi:hypothetical protein
MKKTILMFLIVITFFNVSIAQSTSCQPGVGQLSGVIEYRGKKVDFGRHDDPSTGRTVFSWKCDRQIDAICGYIENGRSDTIIQKVCEGVMNPNIQNVTIYNELHQPIFTGTLHSYWDNSVTGSSMWVREYVFYFQ